MASISVLAENSVRAPGLLAEHGLAWWIDTGRHRVLFDTGQGMVILHNARALGIDLSTADAVVLSHGHFDHAGGLEEVLAVAPRATLFLHPQAVEPKFSGSGGRSRKISTDFVESRRFESGNRRVVMSREPVEVVPGIWMTGEIPRTNDFEDTGGPFFLDAALTQPDPLLDDQAVYFHTPEGVVVVLGCAHAGVVNTLRHIGQLTANAPVHAVLGGAHLNTASDLRMDRTMEALHEIFPASIGFNHCTGQRAILRLNREFGSACREAGVGTRWEFPGNPRAASSATAPQESSSLQRKGSHS